MKRNIELFLHENLGKVDQGVNVEDWVLIRGFSRYLISNKGRVRNHDTDRVMRLFNVSGRHLAVALMDDARFQRTCYVARLVAEAFLPIPESEYYNTPIHLDGDFNNCRVDNLMWKPRWFAVKYARQYRLTERRHVMIRNVESGEVLSIWDLVAREGLLYFDIVQAIQERTVIFPSMQRYEWVE